MTWRLADYSEVGRLGTGATGTVASARHDPTGTFVAIKFLSARRHGRSTPTDWFRSQVKLLADIDNAHIARLYEYVERPAGGALVMELVDGVSLDDLLRRGGGPLEPQVALAILKGSLLGLAAAHKRGLLHRDFRPSNVQISRSGVPKIVDFGVVPPVDSMRPGDGTPLFQAPELWDRKPADVRTDLYAATATFVQCLTGHPPYPPGKTMAELRKAHDEAPIPVADIPEPLRALVTRGLAKDPANRPADATAFLQSVEHVANMRYGSDWERAGEAMLLRRLAPLVAPPGRDIEVKKGRPVTSLLGSSLITRFLVGAAAAAAIVMVVDSGIAAAGPAGDNAAATDPGFAVVLPAGTPTSIPTLLIIPTPGVTLTAPPARATGGPIIAGKPTPIGPPTIPPTKATKGGPTPTGNPTTPTGNPTTPTSNPTTPTGTPTTPPPAAPTLTSFTSDGSTVAFSISAPGLTSVTVTINQDTVASPGLLVISHTYAVSNGSVSDSGIAVPAFDCSDVTARLTLTTSPALQGGSASIPISCTP
jgi:eukaryotic-like serine/threonine-protein kinase